MDFDDLVAAIWHGLVAPRFCLGIRVWRQRTAAVRSAILAWMARLWLHPARRSLKQQVKLQVVGPVVWSHAAWLREGWKMHGRFKPHVRVKMNTVVYHDGWNVIASPSQALFDMICGGQYAWLMN